MQPVPAMDAALSGWLGQVARRPWRWGRDDCTLWLAPYLERRLGRDPAAFYRGTYATEAEARALLEANGGLVALLDQALAAVGIERCAEPGPGDIGVLLVPSPAGAGGGIVWHQVTALCLGPRWAVRTARGLAFLPPVDPLAAWGVP